MKERPILFSGAMVRAILAGKKTQTRRVVKLPSFNPTEYDGMFMWSHPNNPTNSIQYAWGAVGKDNQRPPPCPYGKVGDRLWVREAWAIDGNDLEATRATYESVMGGISTGPYYKADRVHENTGLTWRNAMFMPRWASRIDLEITGVRVERLQAISEADAEAEGVQARHYAFWGGFVRSPDGQRQYAQTFAPAFDPGAAPADFENAELERLAFSAKDNYKVLWDKINGKKAPWESNPWVWVVSFGLARAPQGEEP